MFDPLPTCVIDTAAEPNVGEPNTGVLKCSDHRGYTAPDGTKPAGGHA
jgi:hypothetical protein